MWQVDTLRVYVDGCDGVDKFPKIEGWDHFPPFVVSVSVETNTSFTNTVYMKFSSSFFFRTNGVLSETMSFDSLPELYYDSVRDDD